MQLQQQQSQQQLCGTLKCPRCSSSNTKFCYYNNYNNSQPRHFCKACKRHWTQGGTLRNVPVGGARKNKRIKTTPSTSSSSATTKKSRSSSSCSSSSESGSQLALQNQEQPWQSIQEVPCFPDYVNYSEENIKSLVGGGSTLLSHLSSTFPFITSSSGLLGNNSSNHSCLISPFNTQFPSSSSASTTSSDSHIYVPSTAIATSAVDPSPSNITDGVDSLSWDYLDTFISTDLKLPWEDYFQTQELEI